MVEKYRKQYQFLWIQNLYWLNVEENFFYYTHKRQFANKNNFHRCISGSLDIYSWYFHWTKISEPVGMNEHILMNETLWASVLPASLIFSFTSLDFLSVIRASANAPSSYGKRLYTILYIHPFRYIIQQWCYRIG